MTPTDNDKKEMIEKIVSDWISEGLIKAQVSGENVIVDYKVLASRAFDLGKAQAKQEALEIVEGIKCKAGTGRLYSEWIKAIQEAISKLNRL